MDDLLQVGKAMDMSSMFDMPIEMLAFLEGDISNPELYQRKLYEDTEVRATDFAKRVLYLQVTVIIMIIIVVIIMILVVIIVIILCFTILMILVRGILSILISPILLKPECFKMFE